MSRELYEQMVRAVAATHKLDPDLVCAQVETESSWSPSATRYEAGFQKHYMQHMDIPEETKRERSTSYGLLQIMGQVAYEYGYRGDLLNLISGPMGITTAVDYGCQKLSKCFKLAENNGFTGDAAIEKSLLYYNGGGDPAYPTRVLSKLPKYKTTAAADKES